MSGCFAVALMSDSRLRSPYIQSFQIQDIRHPKILVYIPVAKFIDSKVAKPNLLIFYFVS